MAQLIIPTPLRKFTDGQGVFTEEAATVKACSQPLPRNILASSPICLKTPAASEASSACTSATKTSMPCKAKTLRCNPTTK